jgi:hypothetical protein
MLPVRCYQGPPNHLHAWRHGLCALRCATWFVRAAKPPPGMEAWPLCFALRYLVRSCSQTTSMHGGMAFVLCAALLGSFVQPNHLHAWRHGLCALRCATWFVRHSGNEAHGCQLPALVGNQFLIIPSELFFTFPGAWPTL